MIRDGRIVGEVGAWMLSSGGAALVWRRLDHAIFYFQKEKRKSEIKSYINKLKKKGYTAEGARAKAEEEYSTPEYRLPAPPTGYHDA